MGPIKIICLLGALLILIKPDPCRAEVTFYVIANGDRAFVIEGDDITAGSGVDLRVVYDSQVLTNPKVSLPQGAVTDLVDAAGTLNIKAVQGDDSTATFELHLSFDKKAAGPGGIYSVTGTIREPDGMLFATRTLPGASSPSVLKWYTTDGEGEPEVNDNSGEIPEILLSERNVLQRFRDFKGKPGLKSFTALFSRNPGEGVVQDPPVVLTDGKTPLRIYLSLGQGEPAPDIALSDAKLLQVAREGENGWVVSALPNPGTWEASLIVKVGERIFEVPLVVAPPVGIKQGLNERNFLPELDRFLADQCAADAGGTILQRRALGEYVFTSNYLAGLQQFRFQTTPAPEPVPILKR